MKTSVAVMRSLAAVAIVAFTIWTSADAEKVSPCCVSISRSRVVEPLKSFRLQKSSPPCVKAVIFETERGHYCIDPRQPWVRKKIEEFVRQQKTTVSPTSVSPHNDLEITSAYIDAEKVSPCCVSISRSRVVEPLKSFRLQKSSPPCVKAVIFETERGHFCIDPRQPWVRKKIEEFVRQQKTTVSPTSVSPRLTFSVPQSSTESS
uniref:Chemokine interleukin-8-like domain-containing protein n=1 Tax=Pygocentrus nattereri TaxID=42514 RepID=A0AAR2JWF2_PYGNA